MFVCFLSPLPTLSLSLTFETVCYLQPHLQETC